MPMYAILGIAGSLLGLVFAAYSSVDYAQHLDRHLHDVHCSLIPGLVEIDLEVMWLLAHFVP